MRLLLPAPGPLRRPATGTRHHGFRLRHRQGPAAVLENQRIHHITAMNTTPTPVTPGDAACTPVAELLAVHRSPTSRTGHARVSFPPSPLFTAFSDRAFVLVGIYSNKNATLICSRLMVKQGFERRCDVRIGHGHPNFGNGRSWRGVKYRTTGGSAMSREGPSHQFLCIPPGLFFTPF